MRKNSIDTPFSISCKSVNYAPSGMCDRISTLQAICPRFSIANHPLSPLSFSGDAVFSLKMQHPNGFNTLIGLQRASVNARWQIGSIEHDKVLARIKMCIDKNLHQPSAHIKDAQQSMPRAFQKKTDFRFVCERIGEIMKQPFGGNLAFNAAVGILHDHAAASGNPAGIFIFKINIPDNFLYCNGFRPPGYAAVDRL